MKFINPGEAMQVRIREGPNRFRWELVKTGETINLTRDIGFNYGFEEFTAPNADSTAPDGTVKATEGNIGDKTVETKQFEKDFKKELEKINGIGKKTAKDIYKVFRNKGQLIKAISQGDELPFRDDVEEKLRKEYGK